MKRWVASVLVAVSAMVGCKDDPRTEHASPPPSVSATTSNAAAPGPKPSSSAGGSASTSASASTTAALPAGPAGCVEPKALKAHAVSEAAAILAADPLDPERPWSLPDDATHQVAANGITYAIADMDTEAGIALGAIDAKKGGAPLFHVDGLQVAGGSVSVALSPKGTLLARTYSRHGDELFDAATGKTVGTAGTGGYALSPDESYAVVAPWLGAFTDQPVSTDLVVRRLGAVPTTKVIASWKSLVHAGDAPSSFGVAICPSGKIFAASHPMGELSIHRADDLAKVASSSKPPKGKPAFTRSGKWIVIVNDAANVGLFELVP